MDLVGMRTFCRTVEEGNLTAAAKALHITKSVASRRIQTLEDDLGVRLLARTTRGVTPTDAGTQFYERALTILSDVEDAKQSVKTASDNLVGHLRITAPRSFSDIDLHEPLTAFMRENPGLTFELHLSDERVDVIGGGYDLAIRVAQGLNDTSLIAKKLTNIRPLVVASPGYLEENGTPQKPEDLKDHNCVFYANVTAAEQWRFNGPDGAKAVRVGGTMTTNSGVMQLAIARAGLAIAALPEFFLRDALKNGDVVTILDEWDRPESGLYALYPERRLLPTKVRTLIDFLAAWFASNNSGKS
ncbi:MAG: LysR family transcriptional regulator [Kordiimonadaceae bacterium]|nr:LysR family transcriptional regulator [Kordiimonadaceae bacterium]MBO6568228.1 LysR family transcriptional regulator [Kordiimonadaceae bacterium]MBO6964042.1 LysR family transcriptional regulator [Kordiimonadaceae bacterium]